MDNCMIVTIDGPAGVGKSTTAQMLAESLDIAYLDTGAMFRATAWRLGQGAWRWETPRLEEELGWIEFSLSGSGSKTQLFMNRNIVGDEIRSEDVGMWASNLAMLPPVRSFLKAAQQSLGLRFSLVTEGRDMGTIVFPHAEHKFFLDAAPQVRARRRFDQLKSMGKAADLEKLTASIAQRDEQDRTRPVAPLKAADDAIVVDSSELDQQQVFSLLLQHIQTGS